MPTLSLNDRKIASLKPTSKQTDYFDRSFPGFGIRVGPTGRKTFMLLHRVNGKLQRLTLREAGTNVSTYPTLTLAKARALARAALDTSSLGRDPGAERKQAQTQTFGKLCALYLDRHARRNKRSWREDARMIRKELKDWTDRPVASIRRAEVRELLVGIVDRGAPVAANRVLALVVTILNFGVDLEWIDANVATRMARPTEEQSRTRVLGPDEIRTVWAWLERPVPDDADQTHWALAQAALKLRLITAQRGREVIEMRWADADLVDGWWTVPAEHVKNKLTHRVPLTTMAVRILAALLATAPAEAVNVFAGIRGHRHRRGLLAGLPIQDVRPHDFRRTAASLMAGGGVPRLTIAKILNHVETSITSVYDRHSYDAEKLAALGWWDAKLTATINDKDAGKVLPFAVRA